MRNVLRGGRRHMPYFDVLAAAFGATELSNDIKAMVAAKSLRNGFARHHIAVTAIGAVQAKLIAVVGKLAEGVEYDFHSPHQSFLCPGRYSPSSSPIAYFLIMASWVFPKSFRMRVRHSCRIASPRERIRFANIQSSIMPSSLLVNITAMRWSFSSSSDFGLGMSPSLLKLCNNTKGRSFVKWRYLCA